jgi:uncharacterized damage-inducible protein DinB
MVTEAAETGERAMLVAYLNSQRNHVLGNLEGLSEGELTRPVLPSGWTPLGLVQHLAIDVERFWFRAVTAGEPDVVEEMSGEGDAWQVAPDTRPQEVFALYRQEIERANAIIAARPLDAPPAWWPGFFGNYRQDNLRDTILHVMVETACHAGHVDAARELIDGKQWMVLTE